jgi:hypothetical protein
MYLSPLVTLHRGQVHVLVDGQFLCSTASTWVWPLALDLPQALVLQLLWIGLVQLQFNVDSKHVHEMLALCSNDVHRLCMASIFDCATTLAHTLCKPLAGKHRHKHSTDVLVLYRLHICRQEQFRPEVGSHLRNTVPHVCTDMLESFDGMGAAFMTDEGQPQWQIDSAARHALLGNYDAICKDPFETGRKAIDMPTVTNPLPDASCTWCHSRGLQNTRNEHAAYLAVSSMQAACHYLLAVNA